MADAATLTLTLDPDLLARFVAEAAMRPADDVLRELVRDFVEGRPGTRELVVSGRRFLLVHRVEPVIITILRLFHGAGDWPNMP